jgi:hypothetical protein
MPHGLALAFDVNATEVDLGLPVAAEDAVLRLEISEARLDADIAQAKFANGALEGSIDATVRDGTADVAIRAALEGATLEALVWEHGGLPVASGLLDGTVQVTGSGRSMAGLMASLAGNGSFAIREGRFNTLNPEALVRVMEAAEGAEEPNDEQARETFAIHFGSGALPFGQVAGSFAVAAGIVEMATVSIDTAEATILAEASFDLNTLTLASDWIVRAGGDAAAAETTQPHVGILFSGPITAPERQTDLAPLLDLLRSRYMQRQLDELDALERERKRIEADRAARETTDAPGGARPDVSSAGTGSPPGGEPMHTPALGVPTGPDPPASTASIEPPPRPGAATAEEAPGQDAREAELREMLERIAPTVRDVIFGSAAAAEPPPAAREPSSSPKAAPAVRQAAPAKQRVRTSLPRARVNRQTEPSSPPARNGDAAATATSGPANPAPASRPEEDAYSTLPNGVILKIR